MNQLALIIIILCIAGTRAFLPKSTIFSRAAFSKKPTALHETTADFKNGMTFEIGKESSHLFKIPHIETKFHIAF
jgi:hypothetical protein